jgi:hypothetical protein
MSAPLLRHQVQLSYICILASPAPIIQTAGRPGDRRRTPVTAAVADALLIYAERHWLITRVREPGPCV